MLDTQEKAHSLRHLKHIAHQMFDRLWDTQDERTMTYQYFGAEFSDVETILNGRCGRVHFSYMNREGCLHMINRLNDMGLDSDDPEAVQVAKQAIKEWHTTIRPSYLKNLTLADFTSQIYDQYFIQPPVQLKSLEEPEETNSQNQMVMAQADVEALNQRLNQLRIDSELGLFEPEQQDLIYNIDDIMYAKSDLTSKNIASLDIIGKIDIIQRSSFLIHHLAFVVIGRVTQSQKVQDKPTPSTHALKQTTKINSHKNKNKIKRKKNPSGQTKQRKEKQRLKAIRENETRMMEKRLLEEKRQRLHERARRQLLIEQARQEIQKSCEITSTQEEQAEKKREYLREYGGLSLAHLEERLANIPRHEHHTDEVRIIEMFIDKKLRQAQDEHLQQLIKRNKRAKSAERKAKQARYDGIYRLTELLNDIAKLAFPELSNHHWIARPQKNMIVSPWFTEQYYLDFQSFATGASLNSYFYQFIDKIIASCGVDAIEFETRGVGDQPKLRLTLHFSEPLLKLVSNDYQEVKRLNKTYPGRFAVVYRFIEFQPSTEFDGGQYSQYGIIRNRTKEQYEQFLNSHRERLNHSVALLYNCQTKELTVYGMNKPCEIDEAKNSFLTTYGHSAGLRNYIAQASTQEILFVTNYDGLIGKRMSQGQLKACFSETKKTPFMTQKRLQQSSLEKGSPADIRVSELLAEIMLKSQNVSGHDSSTKNLSKALSIGRLGSINMYLILAGLVHDDLECQSKFMKNILKEYTHRSKALYLMSLVATVSYRRLLEPRQLLPGQDAITRYETDEALAHMQFDDLIFQHCCASIVNLKINEDPNQLISCLVSEDDNLRYGIKPIHDGEYAAVLLAFANAYVRLYKQEDSGELCLLFAIRYAILAVMKILKNRISENSAESKILKQATNCLLQTIPKLHNALSQSHRRELANTSLIGVLYATCDDVPRLTQYIPKLNSVLPSDLSLTELTQIRIAFIEFCQHCFSRPLYQIDVEGLIDHMSSSAINSDGNVIRKYRLDRHVETELGERLQQIFPQVEVVTQYREDWEIINNPASYLIDIRCIANDMESFRELQRRFAPLQEYIDLNEDNYELIIPDTLSEQTNQKLHEWLNIQSSEAENSYPTDHIIPK